MRAGIAIMTLTLTLAGCDQKDGLLTRGGWVRAAPPGSGMTAAYLIIENDQNKDIALVQVTSPDYALVEVHETLNVDGVSRMRQIESPLIVSGEAWELAPGGAHLMMMRPTREIQAGDEVLIVLEFDDGQQMSVRMPVRHNATSPAQ